MAAEERLLENLADEDRGTQAAIGRLRDEHARLVAAMQGVTDALSTADPQRAKIAIRHLREEMRRHEDQEKESLLPLLARTLTDRTLCELLATKLMNA